MSRRNPLNNRYKQGQEPKGKTRKSAASAKPARKDAATHKPAKKKTSVREQYAQSMPDSPEFKRLRGLWWKVLGVAVVLLVISLVLTMKKVAPSVGEVGKMASLIISWIALGLVAFAWWIDLKKVRPLIKAHQMGLSIEEFEKREAAEREKMSRDSKKSKKGASDDTDNKSNETK